jgi:hypothetical protein
LATTSSSCAPDDIASSRIRAGINNNLFIFNYLRFFLYWL